MLAHPAISLPASSTAAHSAAPTVIVAADNIAIVFFIIVFSFDSLVVCIAIYEAVQVTEET